MFAALSDRTFTRFGPLLAGVAMSFSTLAPLTLGRCYVARVHRFADRG